ncbi:UNVERIFIED_CONTAM: hypothetical protein H355_000924, partial [Colinus virginianus]
MIAPERLQSQTRDSSGEPLKETVKLEDGRIGERPEIVYHVIHTILLGSLAMCLEGMKYLWTPYVCMLAAFGVCSPELWMTLFKWLRLKAVHPILLALILSMAVPTIIGFSLWKEIYQIYSKRSAEDIYKILTSYKASFLIIEDSICNEVGPERGCRVKDLLDIANGHVSNSKMK